MEFLPDSGHAVPSESGEPMSKRPRRNHTPAFKAKVALAALHPPPSAESKAKGYLLLDFYSGATAIPGRFSEGLLLRRLQKSKSPKMKRKFPPSKSVRAVSGGLPSLVLLRQNSRREF